MAESSETTATDAGEGLQVGVVDVVLLTGLVVVLVALVLRFRRKKQEEQDLRSLKVVTK